MFSGSTVCLTCLVLLLWPNLIELSCYILMKYYVKHKDKGRKIHGQFVMMLEDRKWSLAESGTLTIQRCL